MPTLCLLYVAAGAGDSQRGPWFVSRKLAKDVSRNTGPYEPNGSIVPFAFGLFVVLYGLLWSSREPKDMGDTPQVD